MDAETLRGPVSDLLEEHGFDDVAAFLREVADTGPLRMGSPVRILKLDWRIFREPGGMGTASVYTPFGTYSVRITKSDRYWTIEDGISQRYAAASINDGIRQAEAHYLDQVSSIVDSPICTRTDGTIEKEAFYRIWRENAAKAAESSSSGV